MTADEQALVAEIVAVLTRGLNDPELGRAVCVIRELASAERALSADAPALLASLVTAELVTDAGPPSPEWHELSLEQALVVLVLALRQSLGAERIALARAVSLGEAFFACFSADVKPYTNLAYKFPDEAFDFRRGWNSGGGPRSGWTASGWPVLGGLEHGVIALDADRVGIVWVSDED
jgi:hypothetical protein